MHLKRSLACHAAVAIRIGDVVRSSETDSRLVDCLDASHNARPLTAHCQLKRVFKTALPSYLAEVSPQYALPN